MKNPCQKLVGILAKLCQFMCVLVVAGFLLAPKDASAQYGGGVTMTTIGDALNGDLVALATLNAALGNPAAPTTADFLEGLRFAFGDLPSPAPATNSAAIFLSAGGGNFADMQTIQNTLVGVAGPAAPPYAGSAFFNNFFRIPDPYVTWIYPVGYQNVFDDLINFAIVGSGTLGLQTLAAALGGDPGAIGALGTVLYNGGTGNWLLFSTAICSQFTNCAGAIATINAAVGGDAIAQNDINQFLANFLLSNGPGPAYNFFDSEGTTWITALGFAGGPSGNCLTDTDGDGMPDCNDPDIDGDGTPNQYDTDQNGDGTVDNPDTDGDGTPDVVDPTPTGGPPPPPTGGGGTGAGGAGGGGTNGGGSTPPTNDCTAPAHPLTSAVGADPCLLAEDTLNMVTADYWDVGGTQFVDRLNKLWTNEMLPSFKNMTAQWHASVIDQTRQFGTTVDSHDLTKQVKAVQTREIEAKKRAMPNERSCVSATPASAMTLTASASSNIAKGFKETMEQTSGGAPGTPAATGPVEVKNDKLAKYCQFFNDPDANAGANPCPNPTVAGPWPNGDIDVEGLLLKDTLHFDRAAYGAAPLNTTEFEAAKTIMTNLIDPNPATRLTDDVIASGAGREFIIKQEQIQAWRSIAHYVIGAMISRRTSIPLPATETSGTPPPPPPAVPPPPAPVPAGAPQGSKGTYQDFLRALGQREASGKIDVCNYEGFCGLYQMGRDALVEGGCLSLASGAQRNGSTANANYTQPNYVGHWTASATCPCGTGMTAFLADQACQTSAVTEYHRKQYSYIHNTARARACQLTTSPPSLVAGFWLTPSGMLAGAHLTGGGGVSCFVNGWSGLGCPNDPPGPGQGRVWSCPPGKNKPGQRPPGSVPCDGNGTPITQYMSTKAGYTFPPSPIQCGPMAGDPAYGTPASVSTGSPPPPPRPVRDTIREIRQRAGVDNAHISDNPSYNEIMLAMTKERFLDPDYYARMGNQISALKQEQASVKAYVSMQLQDIYILQEQINMLLAARAAMKLNEAGAGQQDRSETTPVTP